MEIALERVRHETPELQQAVPRFEDDAVVAGRIRLREASLDGSGGAHPEITLSALACKLARAGERVGPAGPGAHVAVNVW